MNIGELLGAGLLGGVGNAAKGAGDRLREEAKQKRASALQAQVRQDNFDVAAKQQEYAETNAGIQFTNESALQKQAAGELKDRDILTGNDINGQFTLLDKKAGIASAQTLLEGSQTRINTKFSQDNAGLIAKAELELRALLKIADNSDLAAIRKAEIKLQGAIDTAKAAVAATVATKAKTVANERAVTAAEVKAEVTY